MDRRFGGRKESRKTKRRQLPVELEERGARRAPVSPSASSEMHIFGKGGGGSGRRDAHLEQESIPSKGAESTQATTAYSPQYPHGWGLGPNLGTIRRSASGRATCPSLFPGDMRRLKPSSR